jgi:hypothetical protein
MTAFMSKNPKTGHDKAAGAGIESPNCKADKGLQVFIGKSFGRDDGICILCALVNAGNKQEVPDTIAGPRKLTDRMSLSRNAHIEGGPERRTLITVRTVHVVSALSWGTYSV